MLQHFAADAREDEGGVAEPRQRTNYFRQPGKETIAIMWKPNQTGPTSPSTPEPARPAPPASTPTAFDPGARPAAGGSSSPAVASGEQATIGKSLVVKGEVSGSESLFIDGKVEGAINLPGNRVTVGRNGAVAANITAREVVVLGKVRGNISASDRVDIRSEGSLTGDVAAARISIEDGAYFKGGIDIRKPGDTRNGAPAPVTEPAIVEAKS
jgi:cytoskeletal protein CcmA (bactofilin family)